MAIVIPMVMRETVTPTYPMVTSERTTDSVTLRGAALSKMAKWVRWLHSHTVTEVLERLSFLSQPLSDHCPVLRMLQNSVWYHVQCSACYKTVHAWYSIHVQCSACYKNVHGIAYMSSAQHATVHGIAYMSSAQHATVHGIVYMSSAQHATKQCMV